MEINFKGKRALVTGAGKGIGRGIALGLARCGAEVIALTRTQADLDTLVKEVPSIKPLCVDLSNIEEAVKAIEEQGDIHLLVNNAAHLTFPTFLEAKPEDIDRVNLINIKVPLLVSQAVARKMVAGGYGGSIVHVSSISSSYASPGTSIYGASKAAIDMLTKTMALELGPHKIRVNTVNPCVVLGTTFVTKEFLERMSSVGLGTTPLGKLPEIEDVVNAVLYLLSDKAAMVNGVNLFVDGGITVS